MHEVWGEGGGTHTMGGGGVATRDTEPYIHNILYISIYTYTHTSYIKSAYNRYFPQILVLVLVHGTLQLDACPYQPP